MPSLLPSLPTVAWPIDRPFDKAYPAFPGGTDISGAANLCGVPGLFMMNGLGEAGLPTSLQPDRARDDGRRAARDRHAIPVAHDISPSPAEWVVTLAESSLYLGLPVHPYRSHRDSVLLAAVALCSSPR